MLATSKHIILAEDEAMVRNIIATVLRERGYTVLEAGDGKEAMAIARENGGPEIDLLLSDIMMPQMNGIELAKQFKEVFPKAKVMLMSGYAQEDFMEQITSNPNITFLAKPFRPQTLTHTIDGLIHS